MDVFRDFGLAFGAALAMINVLLVAQTHSLTGAAVKTMSVGFHADFINIIQT